VSIAPCASGPGWVALVEGGPSRSSLQDIAALTVARDLRDLRLAQRSAACSPRHLGV